MPEKKVAAKKATPKKAASAKAGPAKSASAKRTPKVPKAEAHPVAEETKPRPKPAKRDPSLGPIQKTRVVFPMTYYEPHKDEIKAPFKAHGMKWVFLGEGKGLYKREKDVHCFTQFRDDGVHYSLWGDDTNAVSEILATWRALLGEEGWSRATAAGEEAAQQEAEVKESEDVRLWKLGEPHPRPGEPDFFFKKRRDEWLAKKPG